MCVNRETAVRALGDDVAEQLVRRLADIRAADTPMELLVGSPNPFETSESELFSVNLGRTAKLVFAANHAKTPMLNEDKIDWARVSRVKIMHIGEGYGV